MDHTYAVLMAGGSGTRFWPLSRRRRPKQVLPIAGDAPMIRMTVDRLGDLTIPERVLVVTGADQADAIRTTLPELPAENVIEEPVARNTAPCIGLAAVVAASRDPDAVLLCLPADHVIEPEAEYQAACTRALRRAFDDRTLVTFGIEPKNPATGYGYIRQGDETAPGFFRVDEFREKPDQERAEEYFEEGGYVWNSGMFAWRADVFLEETARHMPENAALLEQYRAAPEKLPSLFPGMESESVDYGIMEKTDRAEVMPVSYSWDDVGSFEALARLGTADPDGHHARGELLAVDSEDLITVAPDGHLVAALGVQDLVIVTTKDATLVCPRDRVQDVKKIVKRLAEFGREDLR